MDRTELSAAIRQDGGAIVAEELRAAGPELLTADLDGIETRLHALSRRVCGASLERVRAVRCGRSRAGSGRPVRRVEDCCDWWSRHAGATCRGSRVTRRWSGRPMSARGRTADGGRGHAPLDAELGLGAETLMPRLARVVCRAGISGAFDEAAAQVREDHGGAVGGATVRRVTEAVGAEAEAEAAPQEEIARARRGDLTRPRGVPATWSWPLTAARCIWRTPGTRCMRGGRAAPRGPAVRTDHRTGRT